MVAEGATSFGTSLRRQRIAAGLTQEELADRAGLSARGIQDLERGVRRSPHPETVRRLAAALGRPTEIVPSARLPQAPNPLIGRDLDVREAAEALRTSRVVTLTGTGGIGKTRLGLEVARLCTPDYADGVWLIELAPLTAGDQIGDTVASVLGIREQPLRPLLDTLCDALQHQQLLLVVDNCEHVVAQAAAFVEALQAACPRIKVLATSREPLRIAGECNWRVPPLDVPDVAESMTSDTLEQHGATRLFVERARAVGGEVPSTPRALQAVAAICQKLDGLPLGIELAAARTNLFAVGEIADRLEAALRLLNRGSRTAPPRHQSLYGAIDWSFRLLSEAEQQLLEELSVFAGGFTFDAVEAVAQSSDVLELLGQLVDKSLVSADRRPDEGVRYRLQEVLRQFAAERLHLRPEHDVLAVQRRHAAFFLREVEQVQPRAFSIDRKTWLDRLELELDNFRAAKRFFVSQLDGEAGQRLCTRLFRMLCYRGHCTEGRASLAEVAALPGGSGESLGRALHMRGALAYLQADFVCTRSVCEQALQVNREAGDVDGMAWSLGSLGSAATMLGDYDAAERFLEEAVTLGERGDDQYIVALDLSLWALNAFQRGEMGTARERAQQALEIAEPRAYASPGCSALIMLARCGAVDGNREFAEMTLTRALRWAQEVDEPYLMARATIPLARLAIASGRLDRAAELINDSLTLAQVVSNPYLSAHVLEVAAAFVPDSDDSAMFIASADAIRQTLQAPRSPVERRLVGARPVRPELARSLEQATARVLELTRGYY